MKVNLDTVTIPRLIAKTKDLSYAQKGLLLELLSANTEREFSEILYRSSDSHIATINRLSETDYIDFASDRLRKIQDQ